MLTFHAICYYTHASPSFFFLLYFFISFKFNNYLEFLDTDNVYGVVTENNAEEIKGRFGNTEEVQLRTPSGHSKNVLEGRDVTMAVDPSLRDDSSPAEGLSTLYDKDLDVKVIT